MLYYMHYTLAVGLHSMDGTGMEVMDTADRVCQAIQVSLWAVEHAAGITLKVRANLELARHGKALSSLAFDAGTNFEPCPWVMMNYLGTSGGSL